MEIKDSPSGNVIFWNVHSKSISQIYGLMTFDVLEEQLYAPYIRDMVGQSIATDEEEL